ncbi:MAG: agmatine deiminase family protein, partial [Lysobacterales bacterium]
MTSNDPRKLGFYMPAEYYPHERCWMAWPCRKSLWGDSLQEVKVAYARVAQAIRQFEPLTMVVNPADVVEAKSLLGEGIEIVPLPIDDSWVRDSGPNFLLDGEGRLAGSTFRFTAWGDKFPEYTQDALLGGRILDHAGARNFVSGMVGEGGGITVDGEGTVITTESCFLNTNRNPGWAKREVENELCRLLGTQKVIWLPGDPDEKGTDGHVDGLAAFARAGVVLLEKAFDTGHPRYALLQENYHALQGQTDARGRPLDIVFIEDAWECELADLNACVSYINSYLANGGVVIPEYGLPADERVRRVYQRLYPDRKITPVRIDPITLGGGGIHCITQQQPRSTR